MRTTCGPGSQRSGREPGLVASGRWATARAGWSRCTRAAASRICCGLVLVATPGRPLGAVLREQLQANPANAPILPAALAILACLERGERVDAADMHPALLALFRPSVQGFLISQLGLGPAALIARIDQPVLILQGRRDPHVGVADAERLSRAHPAVELALLPDVNHVLKRIAFDRIDENIAAYADPSLPLAPGVVDAVADFVLARSEVTPAPPR